ncbi:MAG: mechanosensitive ion channel family protein, partial [Myxococcota bacterium]
DNIRVVIPEPVGAGVLGLAVGFGAQALVRDVISGFFLILDGALSPGDFVKIADVEGEVEEVGLRITKVRALNGQLFYIPNGQIGVVGNHSRGWSRAIVVVGVAYEQQVERGLEVLRKVAKEWAADHEDLVLDEPVAQGVVGLNSSDVTLRIMAKVKPAEHWAAERELRARIKAAFDASDVEIPFPRQVVYHRQEEGVALDVGKGPADG